MNGVSSLALSILIGGQSACTFVVSSLVDDAPDAAIDAPGDGEVPQDADADPASNLGAPCTLHGDCEFEGRAGFCIPDRQGWPDGTCTFACEEGNPEMCEQMEGSCQDVLAFWPLSVDVDLCVRSCNFEEDCRLPDYGCRSICLDESGPCTPPICAPTVVGSPCSLEAVADHCHWDGAVSGNVRCLRELEVGAHAAFDGGYCSAECGMEPESCGPNADCVLIDAGVFQRDLCLDRCSVDAGDECRWNYSCRNNLGPVALEGTYCLPDTAEPPVP